MHKTYLWVDTFLLFNIFRAYIVYEFLNSKILMISSTADFMSKVSEERKPNVPEYLYIAPTKFL